MLLQYLTDPISCSLCIYGRVVIWISSLEHGYFSVYLFLIESILLVCLSNSVWPFLHIHLVCLSIGGVCVLKFLVLHWAGLSVSEIHQKALYTSVWYIRSLRVFKQVHTSKITLQKETVERSANHRVVNNCNL